MAQTRPTLNTNQENYSEGLPILSKHSHRASVWLLKFVSRVRHTLIGQSAQGSAFSILDQAVISMTNFLTGVLVARAVAPDEFGVYVLLFTGIMILSGFQNALITRPLRVLGVRAEADAAGYFRAQIKLQIIFGSMLIIGSGFFMVLFLSADMWLIVSVMLCIFFLQLQELVRIINITRLHVFNFLANDVITCGLRLLALWFLAQMGFLTSAAAIAVMALSSGIGASLLLFDRKLRGGQQPPLWQVARENWNYGRWILIETLASMASMQLYLYLTALWVGATALAGLGAVQNILNFANVLVIGISSYVIPVARKKFLCEGYIAWRDWILTATFVLIAATVVMMVTATWFAEPLLAAIYTPFFVPYSGLFSLLAIAYCLMAVNTMLAIAFHTAERPQVGFIAKAFSAVITLTAAYPLLHHWGVSGAAVGMILTQVIWLVVYFYYISRGALAQKTLVTGLATPCTANLYP